MNRSSAEEEGNKKIKMNRLLGRAVLCIWGTQNTGVEQVDDSKSIFE